MKRRTVPVWVAREYEWLEVAFTEENYVVNSIEDKWVELREKK